MPRRASGGCASGRVGRGHEGTHNLRRHGCFTPEDEHLLSVFLSIVGEILKGLTMSKKKKKNSKVENISADGDLSAVHTKASEGAEHMEAFGEEDEEEEDDEE